MRSLLLALALLPGATAMGRYVPEGCMETPNGRVIKKFDLDGYCEPTGDGSFAKDVSPCTDDDQAAGRSAQSSFRLQWGSLLVLAWTRRSPRRAMAMGIYVLFPEVGALAPAPERADRASSPYHYLLGPSFPLNRLRARKST